MIDLIIGETKNLVFQRAHFALFWRLVQSSLAGSTEEQRNPGRLDILREGNLKGIGAGHPLIVKNSSYKYIGKKIRGKENLQETQWQGLRCSMPLLQSLIERPVVLGYQVPWGGRQGQSAEWSPHNPGGNGSLSATPLRFAQVYGAAWDPPMNPEGAGRCAHWAPFHHWPAVLANWRGATWLEETPSTARVVKRIQESTGLSAWPQCQTKSWSRSSCLPSCGTCRRTRMRPTQNGFMEGSSCLANLIPFYERVTCLVKEGKAANVFFRKTLGSGSQVGVVVWKICFHA